MRRWWAPALVAVVVLVYALLGEQLRGCLGLPGDGAAPAKGAGLRMATWNLRNFPEPTQDHARLRERLQGLGPHHRRIVADLRPCITGARVTGAR